MTYSTSNYIELNHEHIDPVAWHISLCSDSDIICISACAIHRNRYRRFSTIAFNKTFIPCSFCICNYVELVNIFYISVLSWMVSFTNNHEFFLVYLDDNL